MKLIIYPQSIGATNQLEEEHLGQESIDVAGDWQLAALFWAAGAIAGNVTVSGIDLFEDAPQKRIFEALQDSGAVLSIRANFVRVKKAALSAFQFDLQGQSAIALPAILLAGAASGQSVLQGLSGLMAEQYWHNRKIILEQLGFQFKEQDDLLIINPCLQKTDQFFITTNDVELLQTVIIQLLTSNSKVELTIEGVWHEALEAFLKKLNKQLAQPVERIK